MSSTKYIDISRSLQNLEKEVDPENAEAVRQLTDHSAAEGIGDSQQQRIIYAWKSMLIKFAPPGFRIKDASESELKQLVANLNPSDYAMRKPPNTRCGAVKKIQG